ncbi:MAG: MAPEG family protein [Rhodospirillales bacterium]|tara:strand:+ start:122 stop:514 length:393 start_codon:yes stop_codon:yes gene_type:complete
MTTELEVLVWVSLLTLFMWFPYSLVRIMNFGLITVLRYTVDDKPLSSWAERAKKAHYNSIENLISFAILVVVANLANISNEATVSAALAYFWLRLAHYIFYILGVSFLRTFAFAGGWLAQLCIAYQILAI